MPEREALGCNLGDGHELVAAGIRRERSGDLTCDLILRNGRILFADRAVLNAAAGRESWAARATAEDRPTAARLVEAITEELLPDALGLLEEEPAKPNQADRLVQLVLDQPADFAGEVAAAVELFHDPGGVPYATVPLDTHRETWPLRSRGFRDWLARRFHQRFGKAPSTQALTDAANVLAGKAQFDGPALPVHLRLAEQDGTIYLDLCDAEWRAVAIDARGWRVEARPPVKFRRSRGMLPLPVPVPGGRLDELRPFLNLPRGDEAEAAWRLTAAWLIGALRPRGPYPVLTVYGAQGSAKSTLERVLKGMVDPNKAAIRTLPRDERDLMIAASNGWCLCFDNLSYLTDAQSDSLCRIATGGGFATRELYSDQDETILDVMRPLILDGIEEIVTRGDLLDRSIILTLPAIPEERRRPEAEFWRDFAAAQPRILGAALDAVSAAIANEAGVRLAGHPRMADFARWAAAAEPALGWPKGAFLAAYRGNRAEANDLTLEASPLVPPLRELLEPAPHAWAGPPALLLEALAQQVDEAVTRRKGWPADPTRLSGALKRLEPNLRAAGIEIRWSKSNGRRRIELERAAQ